MTYEQFCASSKEVRAEVEAFNAWRVQTVKTLLSDIAPRLAFLGENGYCGAGGHYEQIQYLTSLLNLLVFPWQVDGNSFHMDDGKEDGYTKGIFTKIQCEVKYQLLTEKITQAEACVAARKNGGECQCKWKLRAKEEEK